MSPIDLPGWRVLPGLAIALYDTPGRVSLGTGGVLLWTAEGGPGYMAGIDRMLGLMSERHSVKVLAADSATGGILAHLLGSEAWRVWYSRSAREQTPETPWVADIPGGDATRHATQGEACVAVAMGLGRWGGA